jgi:anti-anti-sigma regulatory factor
LRKAVDRLDLHAGEQLILDLSGLNYCDSSGITAFVGTRNTTLKAQVGLAPGRNARTHPPRFGHRRTS